MEGVPSFRKNEKAACAVGGKVLKNEITFEKTEVARILWGRWLVEKVRTGKDTLPRVHSGIKK